MIRTLYAAICLTGLVAVAGAHAFASATITGPARVIDGDTVVVSSTHVRLKGVDAAERGTARGEAARRAMIRIVTGDLTCSLTGKKTWRREVGFCTTTAGVDIGQAIVAQGAALSCPRYSDRLP